MALKHLNKLAEKAIMRSIEKSDKGVGDNLLTYKIANKWESIVGKEIADMMRVESIVKDGIEGRCLLLKVKNPSNVVEANLYRLIVQQRVNTYFGSTIISKVLVRN